MINDRLMNAIILYKKVISKIVNLYKKVLFVIRGIISAPDRIADLEEKIANLIKPKSSLRLVSEDGTREITLHADNHCSGIWISGGKGHPMVSIYNDLNQGAVIGLFGEADKDGNRRGALDVALCHTLQEGGHIQVVDTNNTIYFLSGKATTQGTKLITKNKF